MHTNKHIADVLKKAAYEAGEFLVAFQQEVKILRYKDDQQLDFLTEADTRSQEMVIKLFEKELTGIPIVAEENDWPAVVPETCLVIDPLDGTIPYSTYSDSYGPLLSYIEGGQVKAGAAYLPAKIDGVTKRRGRLYSASQGDGCFLNGEQIRFSDYPPRARHTVGFDFTAFTDGELMARLLRQSAAEILSFHGVLSAIGQADALLRGHTVAYLAPGPSKVWDLSALKVFTEEMGGCCGALGQGGLEFGTVHSSGIFAKNPEVLDVVSHWCRL